MTGQHGHQAHRGHGVATDGITHNGWRITTRKGPIISDKDVDDFRQAVGCGEGVRALPEMLFSSSRVTLTHLASGVALDFNAADALKGWVQEGLPPLQVKVAKEWQRARQHDIDAHKAVQLEYDWTFTTPYSGSIMTAEQASQPAAPGDIGARHSHGGCTPQPPTSSSSSSSSAAAAAAGTTDGTSTDTCSSAAGVGQGPEARPPLPAWEDTTQQIDRALLMERDPILFFDEVPLYESDLDDNGVAQLSCKLRVMPRAWLLLLRFWLRVDGCMVRLREARLFCRTDSPATCGTVVREVKACEGEFAVLRAAGAPGEGPAYADGDAASSVFQAVAPTGLKHMHLSKLVMPQVQQKAATEQPSSSSQRKALGSSHAAAKLQQDIKASAGSRFAGSVAGLLVVLAGM